MRDLESGAEPNVHQTHIVPCYQCRKMFDAVSAAFCSCIARERTFACSQCGGCACETYYRQRNEFWMAAPPALRVRRTAEQRDGVARLQTMDRQAVGRPFALVVDDDPLILEVAERAFRAFGFTTVVTRKPEEALEIASALLPDLVLTDALMPLLDGRELCLRLKSRAATRMIKVVVMSALYRGTTYRNQAFRAFGVDEFLAKPVKQVVLREVIGRLLPHVTLPRPHSGTMQVAL